MRSILLILSLFLLQEIIPSTLSGKIVRVTDGDTVILLTNDNTQVKIRLDGINCPEKGQDFGTKATDFTKKLVAGKNVIVEVKGTDIYKRTLGIIWADTVNVNEELLKAGLAWRYKYNKSARYLKLENQAREKKINIWSLKNPVSPSDFRSGKRNKKAS